MTIEIKQLIIRAVVEEARAAPPAPRSRTTRAASPPVASPVPSLDREAMIAECARQVLRELRKGRGR